MTVLKRNLSTYAQEAYRDYALYVLLDRALARYSDGLKPVQRRILYAMYELHLGPQAKPKKAVRAIGDALGKYHPHSDQAGYEALVGLAQGFTIRYPLIEGQGNFGSIDDPKSFASMRYTEVRLSTYSPLLFKELSDDSVAWQKNFDGTLFEPIELPAQLPVLLLNGCSGIAVGLSTEIPPHHMGECIAALQHMIKHPAASVETLMKYMPGPDFPGGGILRASADDLKAFYDVGKGHFQLDAVIVQEGSTLVIKEIPYMSMTSKIIDQLQQLNNIKTLTAPFEVIDESDEQSPVRVVLQFKTAAHAKASMPVILDQTDCSLTYRCYFNALDQSGMPRCFTLKEFFTQWIEYRLGSLLAQFQARQRTVAARRAVLNVYKIAFHSLDQIFAVLQTSSDPWQALQITLKLSDEEIDILSALRLKELSKLSMDKLLQEEQTLIEENIILVDRIMHRHARVAVMEEQLKALKLQYADRRRTQILPPRDKLNLRAHIAVQPKEEARPTFILLTTFGWIKLVRPLKSGAVIDFTTHCRPGDSVFATLSVQDDCDIVFVDQKGRFYGLKANVFGSSKFGEHLSGLLSLPSGHQIVSMQAMCAHIAWVSSLGYGCSIEMGALSLNKRGKHIAKLEEDESLIWVDSVEPHRALWVRSTQNTYGLLSLDVLPTRRSGRGVILWKGAEYIDKVETFHLKTDTVTLMSATGRKTNYDESLLQIKRGQTLKSPAKKTSILIKS